jgi:hypothetical protein
MTDYQVTLRKHRRLAILRFLEQSQTYTSNVSILTDVLNSNSIGINTTRDQTSTELVWLSENGFVTLAGESDFWVATATTQGVDIALGRSTHPHIQRPSPRV